MSISNIVLSAPAGSDNVSKYSMSCLFKPTDNIAGEACYLNVYFVGAQADDSTAVLYKHSTYGLSISMNQPISYASVNDSFGSGSLVVAADAPNAKALSFSNQNSRFIALVQTDNNGCILPGTNFPSCLVTVPQTQTDVTITLTNLNFTGATMTQTKLQQLTVGFTLIPSNTQSTIPR